MVNKFTFQYEKVKLNINQKNFEDRCLIYLNGMKTDIVFLICMYNAVYI